MSNTKQQASRPVSLPHPGKLLIIEPLDYQNPYDYTHLHRHDYFEIIFVTEGCGEQQIDGAGFEMISEQIYHIYPGQVHLMHRGTANGLIVQFKKEIFEHLSPLKHYQLYGKSPKVMPDPATFRHLYEIVLRMQPLLKAGDLLGLSIQKTYCYLQILLISLIEQNAFVADRQGNYLISEFLSLLPQHIDTKKKVAEYCELIGCSADKLNKVCREYLGKSALTIIHEETILEIRRQMLIGTSSLKEIAYDLNFDTPQNFTAFVKTRTGMTPSELQNSLRGH